MTVQTPTSTIEAWPNRKPVEGSLPAASLRLLQVSPSFAPAWTYGGPIESSYQLCRHLAAAGCRVEVLTTDADGPNRVLAVDKEHPVEMAPGLNVRYCRRRLGDSVSPALLRSLIPHVKAADVVHLNAVYSFPTIPTLLACRLLRKPLVWSTRGALQRWKKTRRRSGKWLWERMCGRVAPSRMVLHVTSEMEGRESSMRLLGMPVALVPNGVTIPEHVNHVPPNGRLRILYLGRLDPQKAVDNLLEACRLLADKRVPYSLVIAGPPARSGPHIEALNLRMEDPAVAPFVEAVGQVDREGLGALFAKADVLVLPSHAESFGIVVAEALAQAVPVIASTGTPWKRVEEMGCGLWVDNDPQSLARAIEKISRLPLRKMGERGRKWMIAEYSWQEIARRMIALYTSLIEGPSALASAGFAIEQGATVRV